MQIEPKTQPVQQSSCCSKSSARFEKSSRKGADQRTFFFFLYFKSNTQNIIYSSEGWVFCISYHRVTTHLVITPCAYLLVTALVRFTLPQSHIGCNEDASSSANCWQQLTKWNFKKANANCKWRPLTYKAKVFADSLASSIQTAATAVWLQSKQSKGCFWFHLCNLQQPITNQSGSRLFSPATGSCLGVTNWRSLGPYDCNLILLHTTGFSVSSITQQITSNSF